MKRTSYHKMLWYFFVFLALSWSYTFSYKKGGDVAPATPKVESKVRVGFDIDDTLLFSTPNFKNAFKSGVKPYSEKFWSLVNKNDYKYSKIKFSVKKIVEKHLKNNNEIILTTSLFFLQYLQHKISSKFLPLNCSYHPTKH